MLEWAYSGVNASIPRNVGPECAYYLPTQYKIIETLCVSVLIIYLINWGYKNISLPKDIKYVDQDRTGKKVLLVMMSMVLGIEIGFKLTSRTFIYFLNPCHITSIVQIYLLAAKPSPTVTALFRIQLNFLNGAILAYMFPETESRKLFADQAMYYIQHGLMVVIPFYLMRIGGVYNVEPLRDMSWCIMSYGLNLAYHFWVLQLSALPFQVNLSHMLCPAVLDPFEGRYYRLCAVVHQALLCPIMCKLLCYTAKFFLTEFPPTKVKNSLNQTIAHNFPSNQTKISNDMSKKNGRAHAE